MREGLGIEVRNLTEARKLEVEARMRIFLPGGAKKIQLGRTAAVGG